MVIEEPRTSLAVKVLAVRVLPIVPVAELVTDPAQERETARVVAQERETARVVARELVTDPAAVQAPAIVPVAELVLEIVPAAGGLERGQEVGELQRAPVAAVPVLGHRHVQPAIPLRTKSVTTAHRPDLVPLLEAEEDLAAVVAETTREPVAAEAVIAWAAAE